MLSKLEFLIEENTCLKQQIELSFKDHSQMLDRSRKEILEKSLADTNKETKALRQQLHELRGERNSRRVDFSDMGYNNELKVLEEKRNRRRAMSC